MRELGQMMSVKFNQAGITPSGEFEARQPSDEEAIRNPIQNIATRQRRAPRLLRCCLNMGEITVFSIQRGKIVSTTEKYTS